MNANRFKNKVYSYALLVAAAALLFEQLWQRD